jgi:NAD(P)-dependent dehydrogenase (short-subunit alcohol dehydrogenase family)
MNRLILITGATKGLGQAMARDFACLGHTIAGCGRDSAALECMRNELGKPHDFCHVDVREDAEVSRWIKRITLEMGIPDLVVNNAAVINRNAPLWEMSQKEFDQLVDINIKGVQNVIRHAVPPMLVRGSGIIVNMSSGWGRSASPEVAPYCASKWAIEGLTKALALELPEGMAAVPLNPGVINTEMLQCCFGHSASQYGDARAWAKKAVPFLLNLGPDDNGESLSVP